MDTRTEKPTLTQARCFKDDTLEIARLGEVLETQERAKFNTEHVIHRALLALGRELAGNSDT
jgi:hypothetical protein